ncbi:hypothetical protein PCANC_26904 [Puccinia coronata f. sp. avenae]|uniref:Uncharacterized protein n=1 Tax=Puccinia coronata f. sp. avenae TaxID=200324 RepID=A0A2N5TNF9_9BASI|nr:hypothetical protein PCANC_26904 [Puccinia coronata f. sp. avenae]
MWNEGTQVPQSLSPNERESTRTSGAAQVDFALESDSMLFWLGQPRSTNQDQAPFDQMPCIETNFPRTPTLHSAGSCSINNSLVNQQCGCGTIDTNITAQLNIFLNLPIICDLASIALPDYKHRTEYLNLASSLTTISAARNATLMADKKVEPINNFPVNQVEGSIVSSDNCNIGRTTPAEFMKALFEEPPGPLTRDNLTMHLNALSTVSQEDFRLFLMDMASKLQQCQTHSAGDSSLVNVCESDRPTRLPDLHKVLQDSTMYLNRSTTTSSLLQQHLATRTTLENQDWSHEFHHNVGPTALNSDDVNLPQLSPLLLGETFQSVEFQLSSS